MKGGKVYKNLHWPQPMAAMQHVDDGNAMKQHARAIVLGILGIFLAPVSLQAQEAVTASSVLKIAGFYLGMERS